MGGRAAAPVSGKWLSIVAVTVAASLMNCFGESRLSSSPSPPAIQISDTSAAFSAAAGGGNPPSRSLSVVNDGGGTLSGLNTSVSYPDGQASAWLTATLSSTTAPSTLTLSVAVAGLASGTYTAAVALTASAASNSPRAINVTLIVSF